MKRQVTWVSAVRVSAVKREHGNVTTGVQSLWKRGDRHRSGAQLGTDPWGYQQCNTKPGTTKNSFWSFPSLHRACPYSCVVQLSCFPSGLIRYKELKPQYRITLSARNVWMPPVLGRVRLQNEGEDVTTAWDKALPLPHMMSETYNGRLLVTGTIITIPCMIPPPPLAS